MSEIIDKTTVKATKDSHGLHSWQLSSEVGPGSEEDNSAKANDDSQIGDDGNGELEESMILSVNSAEMDVGDSFFMREPFSKKELEEVEEPVMEQIEKSIVLLEKDGFGAFKKWRSKTTLSRRVNVKAEGKKFEQALEDAKITGSPRQYQQRLFEIACEQNTIIHLGTGSGKTLIALMTIRHFSHDFENGKQTLFLVPSVALAVQQSTVLRANLPFTVQVACYWTSTSAKSRTALLACNIIVATHGAIFDLLMHYGDAFKMENFNLICMDECHYACSSHPYALIMKKFFHPLPEDTRPRFLGLTASPLVKARPTHTDEDLSSMLQSLEKILCATVVSHLSVMGPEQVAQSFQAKPSQEKEIFFDSFLPQEALPSLDNVKVHSCRERELGQLTQLYNDLGPLALSIYCQTLAKEVSRNSFDHETPTQFNSLVNYFYHIAQSCDKLSQSCPRGGRSDKLLALEELMEDVVEDNGSADTVVLIFVERRITAMALTAFFRFRHRATAQDNWIRANEARKLRPILLSNQITPIPSPDRWSPEPSSNPSNPHGGSSTTPIEVMETSPCNSMDQFADAESEIENEPATPVSAENMEDVARSEILMPSKGALGSQFDDASDEESLDAIQQYFQGIRGTLSDAKGVEHMDEEEFEGDDEDGESAFEQKLNGVCVDTADTVVDFHNDEFELNFDLEASISKVDQFDDGESVGMALGGTAASQKEVIRCQALVRNSTQIFKSLNMARKYNNKMDEESLRQRKEWLHQESSIRDVLAGLRRGDINVLIATAVVEEGVDVQACSCVVVFDSLRSAKGYVQMRGRARAKNAKFFVFKDSRDHNTSLTLNAAQEIEKRVENFIAARTSKDTSKYSSMEWTEDGILPYESDCLEMRAVQAGSYKTEHGSLYLLNAKSLINRYSLSLPMDPSSRHSKASMAAHLPAYSDRELYLPSHLPSDVRRIRLPEAYWDLKRKDREQILAMMACVRLHGHGLLSDRLLPLTRNDLQEMMVKKATQEPRDIPVNFLGPFGENGTSKRKLFVYKFVQKNERIDKLYTILRSEGHSLAILSTENLPNIPPMLVAHPGFGTVTCSMGEAVSVECSENQFDVILKFFTVLMDSRWRSRTKGCYFRPKPFEGQSSMTPPFFVGCLSACGQLDFVQMATVISDAARSEVERIEAVRSSSDEVGLPRPRLWAPLYDKNVTYISYGPSGKTCMAPFPSDEKIEGVDTFREYFVRCRNYNKITDDCLLFDAQRLWVLPFSKASTTLEEDDKFEPKKLAPSEHSTKHMVCKELKSLLLPKDACIEIPMADPNFLLLATHLPQFLNHMQAYLTAHSFAQHCNKHLPRLAKCLSHLSSEQIIETLTAKSCSEEGSYDKLEWLGDAVLKLVQTDGLLHSKDFSHWIHFLHEGELSTLRSVMGCNNRLAIACKRLKIDHFLLTSPFGRGQWSPPTLELYSPASGGDESAFSDTLGGKTCADVIEAILGVVYLHCGYEAATAVADELEISLPQVDDKNKTLPARKVEPNSHLLAIATSFTGHCNFKRPDLVQEAFTHSTALHPQVPSYQRLEWVGDAVLCLVSREWIFRNFYAVDVGQMVSMEASLVSNETLSFLCIKHGLLQHLDHCDQTLPARIENQLWCTQELRRGLWGTDPPKVAADVVESIIGAVYLDGGFTAGAAAVSNILFPLCKCLKQIYAKDTNIAMIHPRKAMQEMAGSLLALSVVREAAFAMATPDAHVWLGRRWGKPRPDSNHFVATIVCLDFSIISTADVSSEVAGNRACAFVVAMLKRSPSLLTRLETVRSQVESSTTKEKEAQTEMGAKLWGTKPEEDLATL